jgi:hypothetical protein
MVARIGGPVMALPRHFAVRYATVTFQSLDFVATQASRHQF